jgi:MoxR-like ATPase
MAIITKHHQNPILTSLNEIQKILTPSKVAEYQRTIKSVIVEDNLIRYIAEIVNKTRNNNSLFLGASPRASLAILNGSKAMAALNGRDFVKPEDIKEMVYPVLNHRIILTPEKEMEGISTKKVIGQIIESVEIPR